MPTFDTTSITFDSTLVTFDSAPGSGSTSGIKGMSVSARRFVNSIPSVLAAGGAALGMVVIVNRTPLFGLLSEIHVGQQIILTHIIFNAMLLVAIPFSGLI